MELNLKDKVIVITGSSRGIGRELVKVFAKEEAKLVVNYYRSEDKAKELFNEITTFNKNSLLIKADVSNYDEVEILYKRSLEHFGRIDALVNNAGTCDDSLLQMMTEKQWDHVLKTNLSSVFNCCKCFSRNMIKNQNGKIINIASLKGQTGSEGQTNYSASKAGIIGFTKSLAMELGRYNISVNAVCPGFIVTDMNRNYISKLATAKKATIMKKYDYLNSLTQFLTFMVSDNFHSISGQIFNLDSRI